MVKVSQYISASECQAVTETVRQIETQISGEVVPIVVNRSDRYVGARWRVSACVMLLLSAVVMLVRWDISGIMLLSMQIPFLVAGWVIGSLPAVLRLVVRRDEMDCEVRERATQAFFHYRMHDTRYRAGIMIYVSLLEHRVEILADVGISQKMAPNVWQEVVDRLIVAVRRKQLAQGLIEAVNTCGQMVQSHFPIQTGDTNELPNTLITHDL